MICGAKDDSLSKDVIKMDFLRFFQDDPHYKARNSQVAVAAGQIVKIEPVYYETNQKGERFLTQVTEPTEEELLKGIDHEFVLTDSLGNQYASETLSEEARDFIKQIWRDAK
jgi:hypothetical protein